MNKKNTLFVNYTLYKKCLLIILIYNLGLVNIFFNWKAVIYIYTCRFLKVYLESMWLKPNPKPNLFPVARWMLTVYIFLELKASRIKFNFFLNEPHKSTEKQAAVFYFLFFCLYHRFRKRENMNSLCSRLSFQSVLESVSIFQGYRDFESVYINTDN